MRTIFQLEHCVEAAGADNVFETAIVSAAVGVTYQHAKRPTQKEQLRLDFTKLVPHTKDHRRHLFVSFQNTYVDASRERDAGQGSKINIESRITTYRTAHGNLLLVTALVTTLVATLETTARIATLLRRILGGISILFISQNIRSRLVDHKTS